MTSLALGIGIPVALVLAMLVIVARRGLQLRRLAGDGIQVEGRVLEQIRRSGGTYQSQKRLKYEYRDLSGTRFEHVSLVSESFWNRHPRGTCIDVVYARGRPDISAPLELVKQARAALRTG